jgi:hypothetical protein
MELEEKLLLAFATGLFSLLGGAWGAFLARRSQYEKWLRESRSNVFAKFLELIQEARSKTTDTIYDESLEKLQRDIIITEHYNIPLNYMKIVRLYLPKNSRNNFEKLGREIWSLHASIDLGQSRIQKMEEKLDEIQGIFETNL